MASKYVFNFFPVDDSEARKAIVKALGQNVFVIAGAGSGKTFMLVNRMVSLIEEGEATIDQICAITFTVNAAAEFLQRLSETLKRRVAGKSDIRDNIPGGLGTPNDPIKQQRDREALQNIDLCFAGTIDSFCNLILSEYPLDADIPSSSSVLSEEDSLLAYNQEYVGLSHSYSQSGNPSYEAFVRLFRHPKETFSKSIQDVISVSFLQINQKSLPVLDDYIKDFKVKYENDIKNDIKKILNSATLLKQSAGSLAAFDSFKKQSNAFISTQREWGLNEITKLDWLEKSVKNIVFASDPNLSMSIVFLDQSAKRNGTLYKYDENCKLKEAINDFKSARHNYAIDFLLSCANSVKDKLKSEGKLTFEEYLYTFKELVKKDTLIPNKPLINHIRQKYKYFLLDESQDTSPFQYELFLFLCSQNTATDIRHVDLIPGSIFIVGDPKQSIYRFRYADINSYNLVKSLFNEPTKQKSDYDNLLLELTNNYRSSGLLCEYFNNLFDTNGLIPLPDYKTITNVSLKRNTKNEGLYTFTNYVDVIKSIINNPNYQIDIVTSFLVDNKLVDEATGTRDIEYEDIMILTSGKKNLHDIVTTLENNHIPCYSEDDNRLGLFDIAETIYAIYCYVTSPLDKTYYYNLLTSPLFGFEKKEALVTANGGGLSKKHQDLIDKINSLTTITNPVLLLETILNNLSLFEIVGSARLDYAYYILNKLKEAYSNNVVSTLEDGVSFLNDLLVTPQARIAMLQAKPKAIRISNVHKVKGLEKPVVIILKAGKSSYAARVSRSIDFINNKAFLIRLGKDENFNFDSDDSSSYPNEVQFEAKQMELEADRLRYVAVTRARDYLFIEEPDGRHKAWENLIDPSLFKSFTVYDPQIQAFDKSVQNKEIKTRNVYGTSTPISFDNTGSYEIVLPSKLAINHSGSSNVVIPSQAIKDAAEKGTLIHALMEIYVLSGMKYDKQDAVEETLARYGFSSNDTYRQLLTNVINTMTSGGFIQANGQKEDLFKELEKADEIYCECPFSYIDDSVSPKKLFNGTIDLLYKKDNKYHVVDYKTNYDVTNLLSIYQGQLDAYVKALKETANIDAEAKLYHIDTK